MARNPGISAAAVLTLALGIGANTALFNVLDEALLRPLPLPGSDRIAAVFNFNRSTATYVSTSYADYEDYARRASSFEQLSAYVRLPLNLSAGADATIVPVEAVSTNYFSMLRLAPAAGRAFRPEDGEAGEAMVAMISENLWRTRYNGDPGVIGKTITLAGRQFAVIGIVPGRYRGANLNWSEPPQIWIPLAAAAAAVPRLGDVFPQRAARWLLVIGRLKPGLPIDAAQAELRLIAGNLAQSEPAANRDITVAAFPASQAKFWPGYRASVTRLMAISAGAAALVLLLACANVSSLLIERAFGRRREFAIRISLGAGRGRLIRQLLAECVVLVVPGFLLALLVAWALGRVLLHFPNAFGLGLTLNLEVGGRALVFCMLASLAAALASGLAPAFRSSPAGIHTALKESASTAPPAGRDWLRSGVVAIQVALSMILLVSGGLAGRTLWKAYSGDPGFRPANLLFLSFSPPQDQLGSEEGRRLAESALRQLSKLHGVDSATLAWNLPLTPVRSSIRVAKADAGEAALSVLYNMTGPDYLRTMGIDLLVGRDFTGRDIPGSAKVAIVNRALARRLWGGEGGTVGRTIMVQERRSGPVPVEVVGVARDARYGSIWETPEPYLYLPASQWGGWATNLALRTRPDPKNLIPLIREEWPRIAPGVPLGDIRTGDEQVNEALAPQRVAAGMLAAFGVLAIVLASVGVYGVVAFSVAQRTREIGIRLALGAAPAAIVRGVLRQAIALAGAGIVAGTCASLAFATGMSALVKEISPFDATTYAAVAVLLAVVSVAAALTPALRAARVDPLVALKYE